MASATLNEATLNYTIQPTASTGAQDLTLTTDFGTSNAAQFTIGDPTPSISSVTPPTWNAGATTSFTISGAGFGTNPAITITGGNISGCSEVIIGTPTTSCSITSATDTNGHATIQATVTVPANAPNGTATIQVQSNGYGGSGFLQGTPGQPSQSLPYANVAIESIPAPVPQIMFLGSNVANTTVPVQVGQQIALTAVVPGFERQSVRAEPRLDRAHRLRGGRVSGEQQFRVHAATSHAVVALGL